MTVIAAVAHGGDVWMGADSATSSGSLVIIDPHPKVFRVTGGFLVGVSGDSRAADLLQYNFTPPTPREGQDAQEFMRWTFPAAVRSAFQSSTHVGTTDSGENSRFYALIGWRGQIYQLHVDFSVIQSARPFDAIGSGGQLALAALQVTPELPPDERLRRALGVACDHNVWCRPPLMVAGPQETTGGQSP